MTATSIGRSATPPGAVVLCSNEATAATVVYWLRKLGVVTNVAINGYRAREMLLESPARLLITDRALPPWPGLDTLNALKQEFSSLKVAVVDDGVPDNRTLARSAGADIILARPLRISNLVEACKASDIAAGDIECGP